MKVFSKSKIYLLAIFLQLLIFPSITKAFDVAFLSDIHADKRKNLKKSEQNVLYPANYLKCLREIKQSSPDLIIVAGDLVNRGQKIYYAKLKKEMQGSKVLWAKGNHDSENFNYLSPLNYYFDFENWRFIVLDSSEKFGSSTGYLDDSQIALLQEWLNTEKKVAIVLHHPPFFYDSRKGIYTSEKSESYENFFKALTPNIKYVLTGHWHIDWRVEIGETVFLTQKALTQNNQCNYTLLSL